jgi:hypothetical protein
MIGTTRSRVSFFMNRFREMGFIHYNGGIEVHKSLLNVVLHDQIRDKNAQKSPLLTNLRAGSKLAKRVNAVIEDIDKDVSRRQTRVSQRCATAYRSVLSAARNGRPVAVVATVGQF